MIPGTLWITLAKMLKITAEASQTNDQLEGNWQTELKQSEQIQGCFIPQMSRQGFFSHLLFI